MKRIPKIFILSTVALQVCINLDNANGQLQPLQEDLEKRIKGVENLIASKQWSEAESNLKNMKSSCRNVACYGKVHFTYGYFFIERSATVESNKSGLLDSAAFHFQKVLKDYPSNQAAYQNLSLVYEKKNKPYQAIKVLQTAFKVDDNPQYLNSIAELFIQQKKYDSAYYYYDMARNKDPFSEEAHSRIVYLYNFLSVPSSKIILHSFDMNNLGFTGLATKALKELVKREHAREPKEMEHVFELWVSFASQEKSINANDIPAEWDHPAVKELLSVFQDPKNAGSLRWWNPSAFFDEGPMLERKGTITMALQVIGEQLINENKIRDSQFILENAYEIITQGNIYRFLDRSESIPDIFFDVATDLGTLYTRYRETDPQGERFKKLENELFNGKTDAYLSLNKEAIMKFHTTLGLIYAERNEWKKGGFKNGIFQLSTAIQKSSEAKNTAYLKTLLANGYLNTDNISKARETLLSAAVSYLNNDDFYSAQTTIKKYDSLHGENTRVYSQLQKIMEFRSGLEKVNALQIESQATLAKTVTDLTTREGDLSSYFYSIQRYKIFADIGILASRNEQKNAAVYFHTLAIKEASGIDAFTNLDDMLRLNEIRETIVQTVYFKKPPISAIISNSEKGFNEDRDLRGWKIYPAGSFKTQQVVVGREIFPGARIASVICSEQFKDKERPAVEIYSTQIIIKGINNKDREKYYGLFRDVVGDDRFTIRLVSSQEGTFVR